MRHLPDAHDPWPRAPWARIGEPRRYGRHGGGLATLVSLVQVIGAEAAARDYPDWDALTYPGAALLLTGSVALFWRRQAPLPVLAIALGSTIAYALSGYPHGPFFLAATAAYFAAVAAGRRYPALVLAFCGVATYIACGWWFADALGVPARSAVSPRNAVEAVVWLVLCLVAGEFARVQRGQLAEMARMRAEQRRTQEEQERRQASEERLRIARELHDVLGHHLSLINVQAGVGLHLMDQQPEQAREALTVIKSASAEALREVRSVLAALRPAEEEAPRAPAPGLARLAELTSGAGLSVETTVTGAPRPLPAEVDRAAFRIVQEALTNVRRHAGPGATATVAVAYQPRQVAVSIVDDGVGQAPSGGVESGAGGSGLASGVGHAGGTGVAAGVGHAAGTGGAAGTGHASGTGGGGLTDGAGGGGLTDGAGGAGYAGGGTGAGYAGGATGASHAGGASGASRAGGGTGASHAGGVTGARLASGDGIAGMRARAAALGGTLIAGPGDGGGWRVEAVLPDVGGADR
jgi:signal transduction histidine kinase